MLLAGTTEISKCIPFIIRISPLYKNQLISSKSIKMNTFLSHQDQVAIAGAFGLPSTSSSRKREGEETTLLVSTSTIPTDIAISSVEQQNKQHQEEEEEDPHDTMITYLTGRTKSERTSKERSIIFPVKV